MKVEKLEGLIAAPFTPMKKDCSLNLTVIPPYYEMLKRNNVRGAFINGSTGEGASQSTAEKESVAEAWARCTKNDRDFKVITFVGGTSLTESKELAAHARSIGLYAIALTAPFYFKPATVRQLAQCCIEIGKHVPSLPLYYYHIPVFNGTSFAMLDLLKEIDGQLPNFAGIKYTHEDFMDFQSCLNFRGGRYDMLWGRDENILPALAIGAKGAVGSTYNYLAPLYNSLIAAFERNDLETARALQQKSIDLIRLLGKYGGIAAGKSYMKLIGLDCGDFRLPVKNMNAEEFELFSGDAEKAGFHEFKSILRK